MKWMAVEVKSETASERTNEKESEPVKQLMVGNGKEYHKNTCIDAFYL